MFTDEILMALKPRANRIGKYIYEFLSPAQKSTLLREYFLRHHGTSDSVKGEYTIKNLLKDICAEYSLQYSAALFRITVRMFKRYNELLIATLIKHAMITLPCNMGKFKLMKTISKRDRIDWVETNKTKTVVRITRPNGALNEVLFFSWEKPLSIMHRNYYGFWEIRSTKEAKKIINDAIKANISISTIFKK